MATTWATAWAIPHEKMPYGVSKEEWDQKGYSSTKFVALVIESGPGFVRRTNPLTGRPGNILLMHFDMMGKEYVFANCLSCRDQQFGDPKFPFPIDCPIDGPNQPRLGKCGCVVCNRCVRNNIPHNVNESSNPNKGWIGCPYCKATRSHCTDVHAWIVTPNMLGNIVMDKK